MQLGSLSQQKLIGVEPSVVRMVNRAIELTTQDFSVTDGVRTLEYQRKLFKSGMSHTLNSFHLPQADGYSHAVDLTPFDGARTVWDWDLIPSITVAVRAAVIEHQIRMRWGGVWDMFIHELPDTPVSIMDAVHAYADRQRAHGHRAFLDGPHYELH